MVVLVVVVVVVTDVADRGLLKLRPEYSQGTRPRPLPPRRTPRRSLLPAHTHNERSSP